MNRKYEFGPMAPTSCMIKGHRTSLGVFTSVYDMKVMVLPTRAILPWITKWQLAVKGRFINIVWVRPTLQACSCTNIICHSERPGYWISTVLIWKKKKLMKMWLQYQLVFNSTVFLVFTSSGVSYVTVRLILSQVDSASVLWYVLHSLVTCTMRLISFIL